MNKLNDIELWLLKKAVECKMEKLMDTIKETNSELVRKLYDEYETLHLKLSIIEIVKEKANI